MYIIHFYNIIIKNQYLSKKMNKAEKIDWSFLKEIPSKEQRIIALDTETTGINHLQNHILEICAVEIINGKITGKNFQFYIKPRVQIEEGAMAVNHIKQETFKKCYEGYYPEEKEQMKMLLEFIGDSIILAHNATFDYYFLTDELNFLKLPPIPREQYRCSMRMTSHLVKTNFPNFKIPFKLEYCCKFFKIIGNDLQGSYHSAFFDTFMTAKLIVKLMEYNEGIIHEQDLDLTIGWDIEKMKKEKEERKKKKDNNLLTKDDIDIDEIVDQVANLLSLDKKDKAK